MQEQLKAFVEKTHPEAANGAVVQGEHYRFTVLTDRLIRMEYQEDGVFMDAPTQRVINRNFPCPEFRIRKSAKGLEIITEELHLFYNEKAFSPEGLGVHLIKSYGVYGSAWSYGDKINDLKGTARTLDQADGAVELKPGLMSSDGFTLVDDSDSAWFDQDGNLQPRKVPEIDLYFFGYGHDYLGCLKDFYTLCGSTPLVPRYAMGNWWSRFYPYTEESYLELMDKFRSEDIPVSTAVIDMDWHITKVPKKYGSGWTGYTWNKEYFPDPERFLSELHKRDLHVTLNVHPSDGVNAHEEAYLEMAKKLGKDYEREEKVPFDIGDTDFKEAYYKYLHHPNEEIGVDFWWIDWQQGGVSTVPGVDPMWVLNHEHYLDNGRNGKQAMILSRFAGIGSHRYPLGFSGDTITSWESLDFQPYFTATASNAGYTWWSHDIGGHQRGIRSDEMMVRWVQFGVFSPVMRLHSTSSEFYCKEPWNYGPETENTLKDLLRLRHRMIPYLYTMDRLTAEEGLPLVQPMYYRHDEPEAYDVPNEYYFGTEMIVCPITKPVDVRTRLGEFDAWLPEGTYFDFFTKDVYLGGKRISLYRPVDQIPVFVPAGSIIPLAEDYMNSHIANPEVLEVQVYHGADGSFTLAEDDCSERVDAAVERTEFTYKLTDEGAALTIMPEGVNPEVIPENRSYHITVYGICKPEAVAVNGSDASWEYDEDRHALHVVAGGQSGSKADVQMILHDKAVLGQDATKGIFELLRNAQIEYELKDKIFSAVTHGRDNAEILASLCGMKIEHALLGAIAEKLTMDL